MMTAVEPARVLENPMLGWLAGLGLDPDDYVVFGSGPLLAHELRSDIDDLDVVARGGAWRRICAMGGAPGVGELTGDPSVSFWGGRIQFFQRWLPPAGDAAGLIERADVIAGMRFASLPDVLHYKLRLNRPKDQVDIDVLTERLREEPHHDVHARR
jgi:hypothetical protein